MVKGPQASVYRAVNFAESTEFKSSFFVAVKALLVKYGRRLCRKA